MPASRDFAFPNRHIDPRAFGVLFVNQTSCVYTYVQDAKMEILLCTEEKKIQTLELCIKRFALVKKFYI